MMMMEDHHREQGIFLFFVVMVTAMSGLLIYNNVIMNTTASAENMKIKNIKSKTIESPIAMLAGNPNVVPSVGNVLNPKKAWNDTPTDGMLRGIKGTMAAAGATGPSSETPAPGGLPVTKDNYCAVPTGFLGKIVKAWESGAREGIVIVDGVNIDLGHPGGNNFYDTTGSGCCDTYCRRVVKGGYWSCVGPNTGTTQYEAGKPTGRPCSHYGRSQTNKLGPLYEQSK